MRDSLRELERVAYAIAHDLRSPLRAMSGLATLLKEDYSNRPLDSEGARLTNRIVAAAVRMDALINGLLNYCQVTREEVTMTSVDLNDLLRSRVARAEPARCRSGGEILLEGPFPVVRGRELTLALAVDNLLDSALKFASPERPLNVRILAEPRGDRIRLWVEDNGAGIPPEYQDRIFDLFQTLHPPGALPGVGIGLALARKAAERSGAFLGVESDPGRGSRFWIDFPKEEDAGVALKDHPRDGRTTP